MNESRFSMFFLYQYELHNLDVERNTILADPRHEYRWLNVKTDDPNLEDVEETEVKKVVEEPSAAPLSQNPDYPFPCDQCDAKYKKEGFLKNHVVKKHNAEAAGGVCDECGQVFPTVAGFEKHKSKHLLCKICKAEFSSGEELEIHRRIHFSCPLCDYDSKTAYNLKRHMEGFHDKKTEQKKSSLAL